jgi:hypothetical protein
MLTTHSPVAIDLFGRDDKAQILHVTHDGESAAVERVDGYYQQCAVLEDLDVRASDLLQANGVIWVEGPSDRIYVNHWLRLLGDGEFREGVHYHCAFYGGALLSHVTASEEESVEEFVNLLRINRNAALVMDSDRESASGQLSEAKNRLIAELKAAGCIAWVTEGKEIENYIPAHVVSAVLSIEAAEDPSQFEDFSTYLESLKAGEGRRFERGKVAFARKACAKWTTIGPDDRLGLKSQVLEVVSKIRRWNDPLESP